MVAGANGGVEHWSADELLGELREFEAALRDGGLAENTVQTYVGRSEIFVRWLSGLAGVQPGCPHRLLHGESLRIHQTSGRGCVERTGQQSRTEAWRPEVGVLFVSADADGDGPVGPETPRTEEVDGGQPAHHAQSPVKGSAVPHRVQMAANADRIASRLGSSAQPRPQVAVAVGFDLEAALARTLTEPGPGFEVGIAPGEMPIARRRAVLPHREK